MQVTPSWPLSSHIQQAIVCQYGIALVGKQQKVSHLVSKLLERMLVSKQ